MSKKKAKAERKEIEIRFRGSRLDDDRLAALARHHELTRSEVLRRLIHEETKRIEGE